MARPVRSGTATSFSVPGAEAAATQAAAAIAAAATAVRTTVVRRRTVSWQGGSAFLQQLPPQPDGAGAGPGPRSAASAAAGLARLSRGSSGNMEDGPSSYSRGPSKGSMHALRMQRQQVLPAIREALSPLPSATVDGAVAAAAATAAAEPPRLRKRGSRSRTQSHDGNMPSAALAGPSEGAGTVRPVSARRAQRQLLAAQGLAQAGHRAQASAGQGSQQQQQQPVSAAAVATAEEVSSVLFSSSRRNIMSRPSSAFASSAGPSRFHQRAITYRRGVTASTFAAGRITTVDGLGTAGLLEADSMRLSRQGSLHTTSGRFTTSIEAARSAFHQVPRIPSYMRLAGNKVGDRISVGGQQVRRGGGAVVWA